MTIHIDLTTTEKLQSFCDEMMEHRGDPVVTIARVAKAAIARALTKRAEQGRTPYTLTISGDEHSKVYDALKAGLFAARQQAALGEIGAEDTVGKITSALEIMNRPCEGGFSSQKERDAAFIKDFAKQCAEHGCD